MKEIIKDLTGRLISIDQTKCKRFSCGGFSVNLNNPAAVVMVGTQQELIRTGLLDGRLVDITDQNVDGLSIKGTRHTKPVSEDTGEKVFITVAANGAMSIAIPTDETELAFFEKKIEEDGVLILDNPKISSSVSPLIYGKVNATTRNSVLDIFSHNITQIKKDQE